MKEQLTKMFGLADRNPQQQDEVKQLPIAEVSPSPYQPRSVFDEERIDELCQTIRTHGIIQPIVVRIRDGKYELIAGERRLRAAKKVGLESIPAIIREYNDSQTASIALIENLQRENLTSIEEAVAYQQLIDIHQLTQESLAQRLGKSQSTIANKLRLLHLSDEVKDALRDRKISERHARALLSLNEEQQSKLLDDIIKKDLNVKQTEQRVQFYKEAKKTTKSRRVSFSKDIRLAINTIRQSVEMVTGSGMNVDMSESDHQDFYEIKIKIPKNRV